VSNGNRWLLALVAVTAIWGWSFVAKHQGLGSISPSALNACIFLPAALALFPFAARSLRQLQRRDLVAGLFAGTVLFIAFTFQTTGLAYTTPSNAGFITGLCSVFVPFILYLTGRGRPTSRQVLGTGIALVGLGLLSLENFTLHIGDLLILGCAIGFAAHVVVLSLSSSTASSQASAFLQLTTVGALSLAWSLMFNEFSLPDSLASVANLLSISLLGTALAYFVQTRAQAVLSAQKVALVLICEPMFSGLFGYFLAGDRFTVMKAIGAAMILVGVVVGELRGRAQRQGDCRLATVGAKLARETDNGISQ